MVKFGFDNRNEELLKNENIPNKENQKLTTTGLFSDKEAGLRTSLNKFKQVTKDVKNIALSAKPENEINPVSQFTKILEARTAKISLDEVKVSVDLAYGKLVLLRRILKE